MTCRNALWHTVHRPTENQYGISQMEETGSADLGWLANFQADRLPLIRVVLFDRIKESLALSEHQNLGYTVLKTDSPRLPQTLHSACPRIC